MKWPRIKTVLICIALFLFFFLWNFPYDNLKTTIFKKIHETTGIVITAEEMKPALFGWPGIALTKVGVSLPLGRRDFLNLASRDVVARGGIGSLFPFGPSVSLYLREMEKGGDLYLKITKAKTQLSAYVETDELELSQIQIPDLGQLLSGKLTGEINTTLNPEDFSEASGYAELKGEGLTFSAQNFQGIILPELQLGQMTAILSITEGVVSLNRFEFGNAQSDISGNLEGEVRLAKNPMDIRLDLTLRCRLSEKYKKDPESQTVVSSLQSYRSLRDTGYAMRWSATIGEMMRSILKALPTRVGE